MKIMSLLIVLLLPLLALAEPGDRPVGKVNPIKHVDAKGAAKLLNKKDKTPSPVILDIRTPEEFKKGHLEKAKNIDYYAKNFKTEIAKLDKEKHYIVHCRSGGRSTKSLKIFEKLGFKNIYHLDGGYLAWTKDKLKVIK